MNNTEAPAIVEQFSDSIAIVRFNRSAERNALSSSTLDSLNTLLSKLFAEPNVKTLVFTGTDDVFLSGADIRELATLDETKARAFSLKGQELVQKVADAKQVTIAAINGYCMGGGLDFALACDIRIASRTAVFAHPGARLGIITGWGGTQRLPRIIGKMRALELFVTSRRLLSDEALKIGLITDTYDPVLEGALDLAARVAKPTC